MEFSEVVALVEQAYPEAFKEADGLSISPCRGYLWREDGFNVSVPQKSIRERFEDGSTCSTPRETVHVFVSDKGAQRYKYETVRRGNGKGRRHYDPETNETLWE